MEAQEQACFLERCGLPADEMICRNVIRDPLPVSLLQAADALMIGGAGAFSATQRYPWTQGVLDLVRAAADGGTPMFGSCWGHQIIAVALGGRVEHDGERAEMGCAEVRLTDAGRQDPLFDGFPDRFLTNMGHHDRVTRLPPGAVELAENDSQPNQAFRLAGLPIYGTQFHSELDAARERERLIAYREYYRNELPSEERFQVVIDSLRETTEVDGLLAAFLDRYAPGT